MAIYQGLEAILHEAFWGERGADLELDSLDSMFGGYSGLCLEIGSGSGRLLYALSERGYSVEGLEPSREMRAISDKKGGENPIQIISDTWEEHSSSKSYDAILFTSFVLQILPNPAEAIQKAVKNLKDDGFVYLTFFIPWAEMVGEITEGEWLIDDEVKIAKGKKARCWVNFSIDRVNQRLNRDHRYELFHGKKCLEATETRQELQWFTLPEMKLLLQQAGLTIVQEQFDFQAKYDSDAHIISLLARK